MIKKSATLAVMAVLGAAASTALPAGGSAAASGSDRLAASAVSALSAHPLAARAAGGQEFTATSTMVDPNGTRHVRMERTYNGLPVLGGDLVVHQSAAGGWKGVSQTLATPLKLSTTPAVAKSLASSVAMRTARAASIAKIKADGPSRLVVDATGASPRLAWEVVTGGLQSDGTPSRLATYVDAITGKVLRSEQQIETDTGSGKTLYSGTVPLQVTPSGSSYQLKDATRGNTYTTDMNGAEDSLWCQIFGILCSDGTLVTSSSTVFGDGTNANRASAAADAQYGSNETWDFYKNVMGRNGIWGDGRGSFNRVHYGSGYVNAFWDGTKMTYGDGDGTNYGPLVSLDVAGHEMSHGVTENTAALTYSGESGGLNESTSDIFGTMVEWYAANPNDPGDYLIGEEFDLKNHAGFRRMDKPSTDGNSADCWSSNVGNLDVHYSSGVGNHFFYLLSEGSGAKTINGVSYNSPTCNGSTVTGIGQAKAGKIWYRALTTYMTSSTNYAGARTATLSAAKDLYGATSTEYAAVAAAWSAVSVG